MAMAQNRTKIRSFMGMRSFYRRFIHRYSQRSAPLRNLLAKNVKFGWGEAQEKYFQDLTAALLSPVYYVFMTHRVLTSYKQTPH